MSHEIAKCEAVAVCLRKAKTGIIGELLLLAHHHTAVHSVGALNHRI